LSDSLGPRVGRGNTPKLTEERRHSFRVRILAATEGHVISTLVARVGHLISTLEARVKIALESL